MKGDKTFCLEYVSGKLDNKVAKKNEIFNALFRVVFRKFATEENDVNFSWFETGASVLNDVSCSGDAFLRGRIRYPDDTDYKGYLELTREFLPSVTLHSQKRDISVDRVFLRRYLNFTPVAITARA